MRGGGGFFWLDRQPESQSWFLKPMVPPSSCQEANPSSSCLSSVAPTAWSVHLSIPCPILLCNSVQVSPLGNHSLNSLGSAECPPLDLDRALTPLSQPEVSSLPIRSALKDMFFKDIHPSIHLSIHPFIHPSTKYLMGVYYILGTQNSKPKSLLSESLFICVSPAPGRTIKLRTIATTSKNSGCSLNLLWYSFHEVCKSNHYAVDLKFNTLLYVNYSSIILVGKIVI